MSAMLRHLLLLTAAVPLVPPAGWCCLLPSPATQAKAERTARAEASCPCCPVSPAPAGEDEPTVPPPSSCYCEPDRAPGERIADLDLDLPPALAPVVVTADELVGGGPAPVESPPPPLRPLHLLRCVWLC